MTNLTGKKYGRLTVIGREAIMVTHTYRWVCQCECGAIKTIYACNLKSGDIQSCGCLQKENIAKRRHGYRGTSEYNSWQAMLARCKGRNKRDRKNYTDRGIKVCKRWANSFRNFLFDMGEKPSKKYTLERKDNNKGYCKSNCKWATKKEQARNFRRNRIIKINGDKKCLIEWCEIYGVSQPMAVRRLNNGMSPIVAFTLPKRKSRWETTELLNNLKIKI
jgi:hypothetical protein